MTTCGAKVLGNISKIDGFGEAFDFDLDYNHKKLKSVVGALATLFMGTVVLSYAYMRAEVLFAKSSMDIL